MVQNQDENIKNRSNFQYNKKNYSLSEHNTNKVVFFLVSENTTIDRKTINELIKIDRLIDFIDDNDKTFLIFHLVIDFRINRIDFFFGWNVNQSLGLCECVNQDIRKYRFVVIFFICCFDHHIWVQWMEKNLGKHRNTHYWLVTTPNNSNQFFLIK